jgi:hypothetical protein
MVETASNAHERLQTRGIDAVVIGEQQLHSEEPIGSFICPLFRGDMSSFLRNGAFHQ